MGNQACFLKSKFGYDDTLDAFAVHGVVGVVCGGIKCETDGKVGTLMTGLFAQKSIANMAGDVGDLGGWMDRNYALMGTQLAGCIVTTVWSFAVTASLALVFQNVTLPYIGSLKLRMDSDNEAIGTDFSQLGEVACL